MTPEGLKCSPQDPGDTLEDGGLPCFQASEDKQESTLGPGGPAKLFSPASRCHWRGPPQSGRKPCTLPYSVSIPRRAQAWPLCRWGLSAVLQASRGTGIAPDLRSGAWVVLVGGGFRLASLSTWQPKYLTHDLHPNPLSCLTLPLPDPRWRGRVGGWGGSRTKLVPCPHALHFIQLACWGPCPFSPNNRCCPAGLPPLPGPPQSASRS